MEELELMFNDEPICPHCREPHRDAWELNFEGSCSEIEVHCGSCEEPYKIVRDISVKYSTAPVK